MLQGTDAAGAVRPSDSLETWYGTDRALRTMQEAHALYSRPSGSDFFTWAVNWLEVSPTDRVLDVGCGFGAFHPALCRAGAQILALDQSAPLVRSAIASASESSIRIFPICGWAQALPLQNSVCDGAMSNYVLHHLRPNELPLALLELKRVVKPQRKVIISTHAKNHLARLRRVHAKAAGSIGLVAYPPGWFSLEDHNYVRAVFKNVRTENVESSFEFPTTASVVKYYASQMIDFVFERPLDGRHRPALLASVAAQVDEVIASEGQFSDAKSHGCFVATVE